MASITHLRSFQALEAVLRTGSLGSAARELSVTPAAIGQRIKALEDYLGMELLVRGRTGIRPTPELQEAIPHLSAAFQQLGAAAERLEIHKADEIHVVADTDLAELWLAPRLESYRRNTPNTHFCINGIGDARLRLGKADCEIRFSALSGEANEVVLFREYLVPVSSRENAQRIGALPSVRRLEGFPLLHLDCFRGDPDAIGWPEWIKRFGHRTSDPGRGIRYQRVVHALEAVRSNAGLLLCGCGLLQKLIHDDAFCLPFDAAKGAWTSHGFIAVFKQSSLRRRQVIRFRDWLVAESRETQRMVEELTKGPCPAGAQDTP